MNTKGDSYSVTYQNDTLHSYMVFKISPSEKLIDYQIKIIKDNPAHNLLTLHRKQFDEEVFIYYDITSKITMEQFLVRRKLSRQEFLTIIKSLIKALQIGKRYLLYGGQYILSSKYIYINPSSLEVALVYMPIELSIDIKEELRSFLIDLIVYKAVFINSEEGSFIYRLINMIKSEAFSLEQLDKLIFSIAVELDEKKADSVSKLQNKELTPVNIYGSLSEKDCVTEGINQNHRDSSSKGKLYIISLVQLLFMALALLMIRILLKQNQGMDIYSITGIVLLILSADFLVVKRLGILNKHEAISLKKKETINTTKESRDLERKNSINAKKQVKYPLPANNLRPSLFVDMETTVLSEEATPYAYLLSCQDSMKERIVLNKISFVIGRVKNQVDYVSRNNAVGKVHAEIINRGNVHYIKDLNSRNGTYVNGERIVSNVEYIIKNNDRVAFANSEFKFIWADGAS